MTTNGFAALTDPLVWVDGVDTGLMTAGDISATAHDGHGLIVQIGSGAVVAGNSRAALLLGLNWAKLVGRSPRDPKWAAVTEQGLSVAGDSHPSMRTLATGTPVRGFLMGVAIPGGSVPGYFTDRTRWLDVTTHPLHRRPDHVGGSAPSTPERPVAPPAGVLVTLTDVSETPRGRAATEALLSSYRLLGQMATDVILRTDANGIIGWISDSVQRILRVDPQQVLGQPMVLWLHPDDVDPIGAIIVRASEGDEPFEFECRWRTGGRAFRWMSAQARPLRDHRGDIIGAVIGMRDIHDRVQADHALATSRRNYRLLAENATDAVYLLDPAGVIQWASPAVERVLGLDPRAMLGTRTAERVHPESLPMLRSAQGRVDQGESGVAAELLVRLASGAYRWMSTVWGPARDDAGHVVGKIATFRDIHDEVTARQALLRSERMFRLALDGAPQGMAVIALDGRFLLVNDALCRLVRRDSAWLAEHTEADLLHPDRRAQDREIHDRLLASGEQAVYDIHDGRLVDAEGDVVWVVHSMGLVRDEAGRPAFFVSHYQDSSGAREARHRATA